MRWVPCAVTTASRRVLELGEATFDAGLVAFAGLVLSPSLLAGCGDNRQKWMTGFSTR